MVLRVLFYGSFLVLWIPLAFSELLLRPSRASVGAVLPPYQEEVLHSGSLKIRAWILQAKEEKRASALVVHGFGDSLEAYLDIASHLAAQGRTVLLLDLRGHGGSGGSFTTLGGLEREDVRAGMAELRNRGAASRGIVLLGVSAGAVAVLRAAVGQRDVRAVVAEAPFDTYTDTVAHHAKLLYHLPRWCPWIDMSIFLAEWRAGFDAKDVDAVAAAQALRCPLLTIVDGSDLRMPEGVVRRVFDAHPGPKTFWIAPGAFHAGASLCSDYWKTVDTFLEESDA